MYKRIPALLLDVVDETPDTKTFRFEGSVRTHPGNFIMLTDYVHGEKPFSFSDVGHNYFDVTVKVHGAFTQAMFAAQPGAYFYYTGPHGNLFTLPENKNARILIAGGGVGTAPMKYLLKTLLNNGYTSVDVVNGARTANDLLYSQFFTECCNGNYYEVTDNGSKGEKLFVPGKMQQLVSEQKYDYCYVAGPELMMKAALDTQITFAEHTEYLLERYMKCGIGICGQCTLDPAGIRLCIEGPVIKETELRKSTEFGEYHRDAYGAKIPFRTAAQ